MIITYTIIGSLLVILIGLILGNLAIKKKKHTTIQPTGTVSKLYKTAGGVEPYFRESYWSKHSFKDKFVPIPVEPVPSSASTFVQELKEQYHTKKKTLSLSEQAIEEIKKKEDARVFKEINKGIHIQTAYGHYMEMTDLPEYPKCETDVNGNKTWKNKEGQNHREDGPAVEHAEGYKSWYLNGKWHREDGPAIIFADGRKNWCLNGIIYTEEEWKKELNKPTCTTDRDGNKIWYNEKNQRHREDGPAFEGYKTGDKSWWINGLLHREDGPAIERGNGNKEYWLNNKKLTEEDWKYSVAKRSDLPEYPKCTRKDTFKYWKNEKGQFHREDGPAFEYDDGTKCWYINGEFHREDGPSIEYPNGSKHWHLNGVRYTEEEWKKELDKPKCTTDPCGNKIWRNKEGQFHREDGPAVVYPNGNESWFLNNTYYTEEEWKKELNKPICVTDEADTKRWKNKEGKYHREDGPAIEYFTGTKYWYLNGVLHREDGPTIEWNNGYKEWYLDGKKYKDEEAWKQELVTRRWKITPENEDIWIPIRPKPKTDKNGNKKWTNKDGRWHREDGPAVIYTNGTKAWWLNGKQHREDGPAVEFADGRKHCWYLNGKQYSEEEWKKELNKQYTIDCAGSKIWKNEENKYHREDGPAIEWKNGSTFWYINGKCHREDGPAVEYKSDGRKHWYLNGIKYTEEDWKRELDKPKCETAANGNKFWRNKESHLHREDGPAVEWHDGTKHWYINNKLHREDGPAVERFDGTKFWYLNGSPYIEEAWKKELDKPKCRTDENGNKIWHNKQGQAHREDGPAYEYATGPKFWYINGVRHREDGPAVEYPNGGKCWYLHGKEYYTEEDWEEELNKPKCETDKEGTNRWYNKEKQLHREDGPAIESLCGYKAWYINGQIHREDGPAVIYADGSKSWRLNGKDYTEEEWKKELDKPTLSESLGHKRWFNNKGQYHREDGPAYESPEGYKQWIVNGKFHREDGPAIENNQGLKQWFLNGICYSTEEAWKKELDKPTCRFDKDGTKRWINKQGQYHREDGPAIEYSTGEKSWYLNDKFYLEPDWKRELARS